MPRGFARFADWTALEPAERTAFAMACRTRAVANRHHAFVDTFVPAQLAVHSDGALAGLPFAIKDMLAFDDRQPGCGLPLGASAWRPAVPGACPLVARLRAAGADLLGTLHMSELAFEPSGTNPLLPRALNPWNADAVPGGSSSGAAIAVAEGAVVVALGSDTGGSVRIPAHCCGVTALKPTHGRLPLEGAMPLAPSLDTIGPIARSAAEITMVWPVLTGAGSGRSVRVASVGLARDAVADSDPQISAAVLSMAAQLPGLGVGVRDIEIGGLLETTEKLMGVVLSYEAHANHAGLVADDGPLSAVTRKRLVRAGRVEAGEYRSALAEIERLRTAAAEMLFGAHQAVLLPAMPILAPTCGQTDPASSTFDARTLYRMAAFTAIANVLGIPALALPCGFDDRGVPMAAQLLAPWGGEETLLALARQIQDRSDWHGRVPPSSGTRRADHPHPATDREFMS